MCLIEVGKEVAVESLFIKKVITFVHDGLKTPAANGFSFFNHYLIEVLLTLVLGLGINVNTKRFTTDGLHGNDVTIAWIIVQIEGNHPAFEDAFPKCDCLAVLHVFIVLLVCKCGLALGVV